MKPQNQDNNIVSNERGSALVYILIAIALLAALTVSFMDNSSNQTSSQNVFKTVSELQTQIDYIRSAAQECVLLHQGGDINIPNTAADDDAGASKFYPIRPDSTYFAASSILPTAGRLVKDIRCPGNPGDDVDHQLIFGGNSGKFLPPPPSIFNDWQWYNGTDGVFFWISTTASDAYINTVFEKLDADFADCEADIINATSATKALDSNATVSCVAGEKCFRVWITQDRDDSGTGNVEDGLSDVEAAVFPDETACNP